MKNTKFRDIGAQKWLVLVLHGILFAFLGLLLTWRLRSLNGGYASSELAAHQAGSALHTIYNNPLNAPFTLALHGLQLLNAHSLIFGRLLAAGIGALVVTSFYLLVRHWHGSRTAFFSTALFGSSALFLHVTRLGTPEVLSLLFFILVACGFWLKQTHSKLALLCSFMLIILLLYVPGMIALLALGAVWQWRSLDRAFKKHLGIVSLGGLLVAAALTPLVWAMYRDHSLIKVWFGLPAQGWPKPLEVVHQLLLIPSHFVWHAAINPAGWLGTAPILDVFGVALLVLGIYVYCRHIGLGRAKLFIPIFIIGAILVSLQGNVTLVLLLPFIYLLIAAGLHYLLGQWFSVFPRNPIAQGVGLVVIAAVVSLACAYHIRHYFVAWPQASATVQSFTIQKAE
jgi:hypothetical protein